MQIMCTEASAEIDNWLILNYLELVEGVGQHREISNMESLKQEALNVISKMPDTAEIDDIMYRLYVIDKVRKGREDVQKGEVVSIEDLKKEIRSW